MSEEDSKVKDKEEEYDEEFFTADEEQKEATPPQTKEAILCNKDEI